MIVVNPPDGQLFGLYDAANLIGYLRVAGDPAYWNFAQWLNDGNDADKAQLNCPASSAPIRR